MIDKQLRTQFGPARGYLDTATVGVPPRVALRDLEAVIADWGRGAADLARYDADVVRSRTAFAAIAGVGANQVAIGGNVSSFAGLVASQLPAGSEVLTAEGDFTSILFPFLAQAPRGVDVRCVPLERLAEEVRPSTTLVAVSSVQSSNGRRADLGDLREACATEGTQTMIDATQSYGWLPLDASQFDYVVCHAYKWLACPRGVAFMVIAPERRATLIPHNAGWYAGSEIWSSVYGAPLRLADDARAFDTSPGWLSWVSAAPTLELFQEIGAERVLAHNLGLANRLRAGLGMAPGDSAIVRVEREGAAQALEAAGVRGAIRAGAARLSFHLYNDEDDVDLALEAIAGAGADPPRATRAS